MILTISVLQSAFAGFYKDKHIKKQVKRNDEIIYGSRAINEQLAYGFLARPTIDYDIYSDKPKKSALEIERELDLQAGADLHYVKEAVHKGTWKVMNRGRDRRKGTRDDFGVADYSKPGRKIRTVRRDGLRYAHLSEMRKDKLKSLRDPAFAFRHEKDKYDLKLMRISKRFRKI